MQSRLVQERRERAAVPMGSREGDSWTGEWGASGPNVFGGAVDRLGSVSFASLHNVTEAL